MRNEIAQREKFEKALQFSTTQIIEHSRRRKYLSKRLVELLEKDRRDFAMALHDQIGQILTTLKMNLELLSEKVGEGEPRAIIETAIEKASQAMCFSRNISQELRPATLDTLGLVPSIENLIAQVKDSSGVAITFFHKDISRKLGNEKELALYRILQEALTNIMKHASARSVHVTLIRKGNTALLTIEDDGKGFDYRSVTSSEKGPLGIMIMRERAVQIGGTVNVDTRPGKGTHIAARVRVEEV
jgi:signal transduction histidine kinase